MPDMLQDGMAWLGAQLRASAATDVLYVAGTSGSLTLAATISPSQRLLDDGSGVIIAHQDMDFTVTAAELVISAAVYRPRRGDQIRATIGGRLRQYEVHSDGGQDA